MRSQRALSFVFMRCLYSRLIVRATRARLAPPARSVILAVALSLVSAAFTLWRNSEIGVLVDISYIVNTATRIAAGDVPYAQFPLAQAPLEFLVQALLIKIGGPHFAVQIMYATILGGRGRAPPEDLDRPVGGLATGLLPGLARCRCRAPHP